MQTQIWPDLIQFMQLWFSVSHINFSQTALVKLPLHTRETLWLSDVGC